MQKKQGGYTMKSLKELFRIGPGPSSSHTIGPQRACLEMLKRSPDADHFRVTLYGSLALTGKGHLTDAIIEKTLAPKPCEIIMNYTDTMPHPNTLTLCAYDRDDRLLNTLTVYSIGGGAIEIEGEKSAEGQSIYPHHSLDEIMQYCHEENIDFCAYVDRFEGENINVYLNDILIQMCRTVDTGLNTAGILPGKLNMERIARSLLQEAITCEGSEREKLLLSAYAYAASEENAAGGMTVTAPTLGSSGLLPSLLYYYDYDLKRQREELVNALKVAGLIGNLIKYNATISGAQGGCQAELGAACSMGAAMIAYLMGLSMDQIEYAAEMGIEHHLGLTCDPVGGYVMIPCIERNAVCALRAIDAAVLAKHLRKVHKNRVSFDMVVETMNKTGMKLPIELKESALGGLASVIKI